MSNVSKLIYREINGLFPNLHKTEPYSQVNLEPLGLGDINLLMLNKNADEINFILTHYKERKGSLVANPSVQIAVFPKLQKAEIISYKHPSLTHHFLADGETIDTDMDSMINRLVYERLKELKTWSLKALILHWNFLQ